MTKTYWIDQEQWVLIQSAIEYTVEYAADALDPNDYNEKAEMRSLLTKIPNQEV